MTTTPAMEGLITRMEGLLAMLTASPDMSGTAFFLATYLRTTTAVAVDLEAGGFSDPVWTEEWDVAFASLYLDAVEQWTSQQAVAEPWRVAFAASRDEPDLPPLRHVLLGMNAHINYDLPQALLAMITDSEFDNPTVVARRRADHERIDEILAARVKAEDHELKKVERPGDRTLLDRALTPFNRRATRQFLKESRAKVWRNAHVLSRARQAGRLDARLHELEGLAAQRVADLCAPRQASQVAWRLARDGFGVELSSAT